MYFKELKLYYCLLMVFLEANGALDATNSIMDQNSDDLKSLDLCTSQNQQRLGSVFGNFTRHHKKGHRRKTTTYPTTMLTLTDDVTSFMTTQKNIEETTSNRLPNPQRLSSFEFEDLETRLQHKHEKHRRHSTNREIILDHEGLAKRGHNIVKKAYRDSGSAVNKLNRVGKGGIFLTENCTTVIAQIGTTAVLHCEVSDITENTVTWIRRKDYSLLSVGLVTYSADNRFFSAHGRHVKDWALHIRFATSVDAGYYECQVPTHPPTSIFFKLVLVAAYAEIMGESEKIIHEGSMLRLVCVVRRSTEPPSYVFWYFEDRMINYDLNGVSVHNGRQTSELIIGKAEPRHSGNYTCVPANAKAASVTVHVVQSETPAAMQHGNSSSSKSEQDLLLHLVMSVVCILELVYREYG